MREKEAEEVVDLIVSFFPSYVSKRNDFDKPEVRVNYLMDRLLERDFKATMSKVKHYLETSPYEPKLSDILPPIKDREEQMSVEEALRQKGGM